MSIIKHLKTEFSENKVLPFILFIIIVAVFFPYRNFPFGINVEISGCPENNEGIDPRTGDPIFYPCDPAVETYPFNQTLNFISAIIISLLIVLGLKKMVKQ